VVFEPADLGVVRGSPSYRRRLLDRAVFNWRSGFLGQAQTLDRVLRSRNAVLRGGRTSGAMALLEVYDQQLATAACKVAESRVAYLAALRPVFRSTWTEIFGPAVQADLGLLDSVSKGEMKEDERVSGRASAEERTKASSSMSSTDSDQQSRRWEAHFAAYEATILALLEGSRPADFARGCTTVGPHRDDLEFRLDGRRAAAHASQGQLRALCLAFKIAEVRLLRTASGEDPVLLLDDVSSELDASRNHNLIELLGVASGQAIWTTTERRHLARTCDNALCFQVVGGELLAGSGSELLPGS
jgi:DNA replication and repair protein RecF